MTKDKVLAILARSKDYVSGEEISNILDPNVDRGALSGDIIMKQSYCTDKLGVVTKEDENYVFTAILPRALYDKVDH